MIAYVCWVGFAHDDVQYRDVAAGFAWFGRYHLVLRLKQSSHDIKYSRLPNGLRSLNIITRERRIAGLQEMTSWSWYQTRNNTDEIVMHVARISQRSR